jgi:small subunit ribosomal protein S20
MKNHAPVPLWFNLLTASGKLRYLVSNPSTLTFASPKINGIKSTRKMANHSATKKDVRQAAKRRERNKYYGKTTRNAIRELKDIKDSKEAAKKLPEVAAMIDKLAKKGIIHKNKAANLKSGIAKKLNASAK